MQTSETLIAAKALFGRFGQRWTRGMLHRHSPLTGDNYCSIGAIRKVGGNYKARDYLNKAIKLETGKDMSVENFNDFGRFNFRELPALLGVPLVLAAMFIPGVRMLRWLKIKRVWCRAIKLAVEDELRQEESCSKT